MRITEGSPFAEVVLRLHLLIVAMLLVPGSARAQRAGTADSVMQLNRHGHWADAATLATRELATPQPAEEACPVRSGLLWAQTRLHRVQAARATLARYDRLCANAYSARPFASQVARVRKELTNEPVDSVASPRKNSSGR